MAGGKGIRRVVELALDALSARRMRDAAQRALDEATDPKKAQRNLSRAEAAFDRIKGAALKLGGAIAAAFALDRIAAFGAEAVRVAMEAEAGFSRLTNTLRNVGVEMDKERSRIEAVAAGIQNSTRFDDDAVFGALDKLVGLTGRYEASLAALPLVADVAAARQVDMATAAELVGRVMTGQTRVLRQFGITTNDANEGLRLLGERMRGAAAADAQTLGGQVAMLSNAWDNFKEAIGAALIEAGGGTSIISTLTGVVKTATEWVNNNSGRLVEWAKALGTVGTWVGWLAVKFAEGWGKIIDWLILAGTRFNVMQGQVDVFRYRFAKAIADAMGDAARKIQQFVGYLSRLPTGMQALLGITGLAGRGLEVWANAFSEQFGQALSSAESRLASFRAEFEAARSVLGRDPGGRTTAPGAGSMGGGGIDLGAPSGPSGGPRSAPASTGSALRIGSLGLRDPLAGVGVGGRIAETEAELRGTRDRVQEFFLAMQVAAVETGAVISDNMTEAFQRMWEEGATIGGLFNAMWEGIATTATDAIASMAKSKATENFIFALEEAAKALSAMVTPGLQGKAAKHWKSSGMHFAAGVSWAALAGGGAAASGALRGGGGAGGHGGFRADGRQAVDESKQMGPEVHVYVDGFDAFNPRHQEMVYAGHQLARERYGDNARVTVHPRRG